MVKIINSKLILVGSNPTIVVFRGFKYKNVDNDNTINNNINSNNFRNILFK